MHVTYQVNLQTPQSVQGSLPYTGETWDTSTIDDTKLALIPNQLINNRKLVHGDTFTAANYEANYLLQFTTGLYPMLTIVSQTV